MKAKLGLWLGIAFLLTTGSANAVILSVDAVPGGAVDTNATVNVSTSFDVAVLIDDVTDMAGFQFQLDFDPAVVSATAVTSGDIFGLDTFLVDDTITAAAVSFAETTFAAVGVDVTGPVLLATISFNAVAAGTSALSLSGVVVSDSFFTAIVPVVTNDATVNVRASNPNPAQVPEPGSALLLLTALPLLGSIAKHRS